jgi:hypothetical protein
LIELESKVKAKSPLPLFEEDGAYSWHNKTAAKKKEMNAKRMNTAKM